VKLREILSTNAELAKKIAELEEKYDNQFKVVFEALKALIADEPQKTDRPLIGYKPGKRD
jgi:hypothetical protein